MFRWLPGLYYDLMLSLAGVLVGVVILVVGGTMLVRGASEVAASLGVTPMVVGLTIVAFGTSAPELVVNVTAVLDGQTGLAFGNVAGSNISNLALVLGVAALMQPITIRGDVVRRELPLLLLATTVMTVMALDGPLTGRPAEMDRVDSIILLVLFCVFIYVTVLDFVRVRGKDPLLKDISHSATVVIPEKGRHQWWLLLAGGLLLAFGGKLTVSNAVVMAAWLGVSPAVIWLFVVAVGTSMPELATSAIAAWRNESDLALGNVIGSNIFDSLVVLPASGVIRSIPVPAGGASDLVFSWVMAGALIPLFLFGNAKLGRITGVIFVLSYFLYAAWRVRYPG